MFKEFEFQGEYARRGCKVESRDGALRKSLVILRVSPYRYGWMPTQAFLIQPALCPSPSLELNLPSTSLHPTLFYFLRSSASMLPALLGESGRGI